MKARGEWQFSSIHSEPWN